MLLLYLVKKQPCQGDPDLPMIEYSSACTNNLPLFSTIKFSLSCNQIESSHLFKVIFVLTPQTNMKLEYFRFPSKLLKVAGYRLELNAKAP